MVTSTSSSPSRHISLAYSEQTLWNVGKKRVKKNELPEFHIRELLVLHAKTTEPADVFLPSSNQKCYATCLVSLESVDHTPQGFRNEIMVAVILIGAVIIEESDGSWVPLRLENLRYRIDYTKTDQLPSIRIGTEFAWYTVESVDPKYRSLWSIMEERSLMAQPMLRYLLKHPEAEWNSVANSVCICSCEASHRLRFRIP